MNDVGLPKSDLLILRGPSKKNPKWTVNTNLSAKLASRAWPKTHNTIDYDVQLIEYCTSDINCSDDCLDLQEAQLSLGDRATRKHAKDCWNGRGNDNLGWDELQMYFKVTKSGTNRKLVYDFLLVVYSNFCRITHRFWEIWYETVKWP